jgi:tripartite-type tricarboxylate transporter receptor subunit TctC
VTGFKSAATALLAVVSLLASGAARAQDWPNKPVKVVVPFAAAGTTDRMGRLISEELSKTFKQQFFVENRVGGGGVVGALQVARADPDGYTLMIGGYGPHIFAPATTANLGFDALTDFTHIAMIGGESFIIVAHPALGVRSFADLVQFAKKRSGALNMASPGQSTLGALVVEQLMRKPGLLPKLNHVPYRGGGPVMTDLLGNHVSLGCIVLSAAIEHIHAGTLVPLALVSTERAPALKELPTIVELGHPDIGGAIWSWLAGPKGPACADGRPAQSGGSPLATGTGTQAAIRARPVPLHGRRRSHAQRLHCRRVEALDRVLPGIRLQATIGRHQPALSCLR